MRGGVGGGRNTNRRVVVVNKCPVLCFDAREGLEGQKHPPHVETRAKGVVVGEQMSYLMFQCEGGSGKVENPPLYRNTS